MPVPGFYLWYAVRGFFENGGNICYVVRASNGAYQRDDAERPHQPGADGRPVVQLRARQPGAPGITVNVTDTPLLDARARSTGRGRALACRSSGRRDATVAVAADGPIAAEQVANRFKPGDEVSFSAGTDRRVVSSVSGGAVRFTLAAYIRHSAAAHTMRLANTRDRRAHDSAAARRRRSAAGRAAGAGNHPDRRRRALTSDTQIVESVISEVLTEGAQGGLSAFSYRVTFRSGSTSSSTRSGSRQRAHRDLERDRARRHARARSSSATTRLSMDPAHPRYLIDIVNADAGGLLTASLIEPPPPNTRRRCDPARWRGSRHGSRRAGAAEDLSR